MRIHYMKAITHCSESSNNFRLFRLTDSNHLPPAGHRSLSDYLKAFYSMSTRRSSRLKDAAGTSGHNISQSPTDSSLKGKADTRKRRKLSNSNDEKAIPARPNLEDQSSTPKRKTASRIIPPVTPTPSIVKILSSPYQKTDRSPPALRERLAIPQITNAPLVTPETHRLVASKPVDELSPTKKNGPISTTSNILDEALAHLKKTEPKLIPIIERYHCNVFSPEGLAEEIDPFNSLTSGIISQQVCIFPCGYMLVNNKCKVSGAAAKSIKQKFVALFNPELADPTKHVFPTPSQVVASNIATLRTAGLSQRKAEYVFGLAEKFHSREITTEFLFAATYEEVFDKLIAVRGLGKWSVEMFACFGLKRLDVFSTGDLGIQRGMAALAGRDVARLKNGKGKWKYMSEKDMESISDKFRPYRQVLCKDS